MKLQIQEDRIEKQIHSNVPVARVWRALTDHHEFGQWFRVKIDGPFVAGQTSRGQMTIPGYEHVKWEAVVLEIDTERFVFAYSWHPYAVEADAITRRKHPRASNSGWSRAAVARR